MQPNLLPDRTLDGGSKNNEFRAAWLLRMDNAIGDEKPYFRQEFCALPADLQMHAHGIAWGKGGNGESIRTGFEPESFDRDGF